VARRCGTQREGRISSARGVRVCGPAREWGQKAQRRKRTANIPSMSVTLEVSKLSGWLKASASCRESKGGTSDKGTRRVWHGEMWHRGKGISAAHAACACVAQLGSGPGGRRRMQAEAHSEHAHHVCDAGGVKAQRLVKSLRILPSPKGATDRGTTRMACGTQRVLRANQQRTRRA